MDNNLKQILRLYGELGPTEDSSTGDPSVKAERADLERMKKMLDERPRVAVPESAVARVLEFARDDRAPQPARSDRRPLARRRGRPLFAAAGSTLALLIIASLLLLKTPAEEEAPSTAKGYAATEDVAEPKEGRRSEPAETPFRTEATTADAAPEARAQKPRVERQERVRSEPAARPAMVAASAQPQVVTAAEERIEPGLSWDDAQDVRRLHMMIDVLQGRGDEIDWDEPAVPLELLPNGREAARGGFYQVSQPVPHR